MAALGILGPVKPQYAAFVFTGSVFLVTSSSISFVPMQRLSLILSDCICVCSLRLGWLTSVKPPRAVKKQRANGGNLQSRMQCWSSPVFMDDLFLLDIFLWHHSDCHNTADCQLLWHPPTAKSVHTSHPDHLFKNDSYEHYSKRGGCIMQGLQTGRL